MAALLVLFLAFGFYRVYYGKHVYETVAPELPANLNKPAILIFSKTNGFRQDDAVKAANSGLSALAKRRGWTSFALEKKNQNFAGRLRVRATF